jgi:hypothetical protein
MSNLDGATLLDFLIGDFETAWNAVAALPSAGHRGNFMFAFQAISLLEVASRASDDRGLETMADAIRARDGRYFTKLPGDAPAPRDVKLPGTGTTPERQLLHALFDLVRNGQAHQYQPTVATLSDGQHLHFALTGAEHGYELARVSQPNGREGHLRAEIDPSRDVWLRVRTDVLFSDIRDAVRSARLPGRPFRHLEAPTADAKKAYKYTSDHLVQALVRGGHFPTSPTFTLAGYLPTSEPLSPTCIAGPVLFTPSSPKGENEG